MDSKILVIIAKLRHLRQSHIGALAGVSRQAVSLWAKQPTISLRSANLRRLADGLGVMVDDLERPLPVLSDERHARASHASLLWDRLFPTIEELVIALVKRDPRAIARIVEVYGLYASAKIIGPSIWKGFEAYKRHIPPVRRAQCEQIWKLHENPGLI